MKNKSIKSLAATAIMASASLSAPGVFATNPYGINYTGGAQLGASNVQISPDTINKLTTLMPASGLSLNVSSSNRWKNGYIKEGDHCIQAKYFTVSANDTIGSSEDVSVTYNREQYSIVTKIKGITIEGVTDNSRKFNILVIPGRTTISADWGTYNDSTCTTATPDQSHLSSKDGERIFIDTNIKIYRKGSTSPFTAKELYFGLTDIDAKQSYKILNNGNLLSSSNMFAKNAADLQPTDTDLRNMFVANGNYIYSQYNTATGAGFNIPDKSNIFVKLNETTQSEGLDMVFGFAAGAGSAVAYYAQQYQVNYESDPNGKITGITNEEVIAGENPLGTEEAPNQDYKLTAWIANVDVTLDDGTAIQAGNDITTEQIKHVVVDRDITFKALHASTQKNDKENTINVPNTGESTGEINAILVPVSVVGILLGALFIRSLPRLFHKKVGFNK